MSDEAKSDPYAVVLADLRAQRERIDTAIAALESLRAGSGGAVVSAVGTATGTGSMKAVGTSTLGAGAFLGLSIVDAAKKLLGHERRQMNNAEIVERLKNGGLVLNSIDPLNTVGSVLNRRFLQIGDVVRVGRGTWGLKEWYPNRTFKPTSKRALDLGDPPPSADASEDILSETPAESPSGFSDQFG